GWTAAQMARRLEANKFTAANEFYQAAYPVGALVSPWEGRLFPDTYLLPQRGTAKQLLAHLTERFNEVAEGLPKEGPVAGKGKRLTTQEIVVLASLVERETSINEERPLVAGVLLNRLRKGMRLQCDASVQYARQRAAESGLLEEGHKERLLFRDLEIDSPFNTYRNAGLPPGPICNPGKASLLAAAMPKSSPYFFYVMSPKLNRHRFAVTFDEHRRNIRLAKSED
ncbi:MAG TPA: endolytic transglycosylase MltG, partial [Abditibacteriaceae bacterium]